MNSARRAASRRSVGAAFSILDIFQGGLIILMLLFGPWALGTTQVWSIDVMNKAGWVCWGVVGLKSVRNWIRLRQGWSAEESGCGWSSRYSPQARRVNQALAVVSGLILLYILVSAVNARAAYVWGSMRFDYQTALAWLPHSYARDSTWQAFRYYLGLAGFFWMVRDWVLSDGVPEEPDSGELPKRLRILLWVVSINGALLATEGIIQRVTNSSELLWLVQPRINTAAEGQFGPYAYRSNAAQYFNLLWPVTLGFWWTCRRAGQGEGHRRRAATDNHHHILLSCVLLMAVCPVVSSSRGGSLVMGATATMAAVVLWMAHRQRPLWKKLAILGGLAAVILLSLSLGWEELGPRFETYKEGLLGREALNLTGRRMADAQPVFGIGPGTFSTLYPFFRRSSADAWPAQLHNDWLETLICFGWVGTGLLVLAFLLAVFRWFSPGGVCGEKHFVMLVWIALLGCLVHARFDFPLQVHSVLAMFLFLCALLSCLSRRSTA